MVILYADDDTDDQELFSDALEEIYPNSTLVLAQHGKEVIQFLKKMQPLPDYIFLDINMPVMDGMDCLVTLKSTKGLDEIPIIMYTTTSNKKELQKFLDSGADNFIVKNSSFQGIKDSLKKVLYS